MRISDVTVVLTSVSGVPRLVQNAKTTVEDTCSTNSVRRALTADHPKNKSEKIGKRITPMQLRQRSNDSRWLIVVFSPSSFVANLFLPLHLKLDTGERVVRIWYPSSLAFYWLPTTMNSIMTSLRKKTVSNPYYHAFLLNHVGSLALTVSRIELERKFSSEQEANDYFILTIIDAYLKAILRDITGNINISRLKRRIPEVKYQWMIKRDRRRRDELYLGVLSFKDELSRCVDEFYNELKKVWGFSPDRDVILVN